ncbi:response regulator [Terrabacter sp. GCM10028922]|uniref:response regulator n=1 Tax=Terrabacter sp. GCM10028922 TaxID=3273428 RepID=UPI00360C28E3
MRLVVADDHALILDALCMALAGEGHDVVKAHCPEEAVEAARVHQPDVCLLDASFPEGSGIDVIADIRAASSATKVVMFSGDASVQMVARAIAAGAAGFMRKDRPLSDLLEAIAMAARGHLAIEPTLLQSALRARDRGDEQLWMLTFLTDREWQVLRCVVDGLSTIQIAAALQVRPSTARTHVQNVLAKLGVHSRLQASALVAAHVKDVAWPAHVRASSF